MNRLFILLAIVIVMVACEKETYIEVKPQERNITITCDVDYIKFAEVADTFTLPCGKEIVTEIGYIRGSYVNVYNGDVFNFKGNIEYMAYTLDDKHWEYLHSNEIICMN